VATFAFLAASCIAAAGARAVSIELKGVASDRIERQRAAAAGELPLPGTPALGKVDARLKELGIESGAPILIRAFKASSELELWMRRDDTYVLFATYPVCHWSGGLGPKLREGDRQTPEGFYTVTRRQLHHVGRWRRSLDLGFPNPFDESLGRTGSYILIHGGCSSIGCFAMTNPVAEEIYGLAIAAVRGGQTHIPVHVFPFRMTEANLETAKDSPWRDYWLNLKEGYDSFERTHRPSRVSVCNNRYQFQDLPAAEAADAGPLAVCTETVAAIRNLAESRKHARLTALLAKSGLPLPMMPPFALGGPVGKAARNSDPLITQTSVAPKIPCSLGRASCRKFLSLRRNVAGRKLKERVSSSSRHKKSSKHKRREARR
jgi:murein L,D-transpeptidase YafK